MPTRIRTAALRLAGFAGLGLLAASGCLLALVSVTQKGRVRPQYFPVDAAANQEDLRSRWLSVGSQSR